MSPFKDSSSWVSQPLWLLKPIVIIVWMAWLTCGRWLYTGQSIRCAESLNRVLLSGFAAIESPDDDDDDDDEEHGPELGGVDAFFSLPADVVETSK